jgi:hypothetical protein
MPRGFRERRSGIRTIWGGLGTVKAFFPHRGQFHDLLLQLLQLRHGKSRLAQFGLRALESLYADLLLIRKQQNTDSLTPAL